MRITVLVLLLSLAGAPPARAQAEPPPLPLGTKVVRDLPYVERGHERQKLDLYLPSTGSRWPLVVAIHGGAFRMGSKEGEPAGLFVARGFAVAAINYRLSQHATFPAQIEDCKAAVRWLRAHAAEYGYDPDHIGAFGQSAGGHLSAMLGTTGDVKAFDVGAHLDVSSRVQAVADLFGPTDFLQMDAHRVSSRSMVHDTPDSPESQLIGGPIRENSGKVARANPVTYVSADDPPFLVVHGDADELVPHHQSVLLDEALRKAGVSVTFVTVPGGPHGGRTTEQGIPLALDFFAKALGRRDSGADRAAWLREARFGVFMHFLPPDAKGLDGVGAFDVDALAEQLAAVGAKYFVITLGQNSGYFVSPNATYDRMAGYRAGERCATRDLPLALSDALRARGIRLMLYLPSQPPNEDPRAQRAFGLPVGKKDQPLSIDAARRWAAVIQEWSDRYADRVSGWWFDGAYDHVRFDDRMADVYAAAARHGHPGAIVTFNPGVMLVRHTRAEDYTAGETNEPFGVVPASPLVDGAQWHALTYLGRAWGQRDTRFPTERWTTWVGEVVARGGVVTIDAGPNWDPTAGPIGALSAAQLAQLTAMGKAAATR